MFRGLYVSHCPVLVISLYSVPLRWRAARDAEGRVYYYNTKTRETSWTPPSPPPSGDGAVEDEGEEECVEMDTASTDSDDNNGNLFTVQLDFEMEMKVIPAKC